MPFWAVERYIERFWRRRDTSSIFHKQIKLASDQHIIVRKRDCILVFNTNHRSPSLQSGVIWFTAVTPWSELFLFAIIGFLLILNVTNKLEATRVGQSWQNQNVIELGVVAPKTIISKGCWKKRCDIHQGTDIQSWPDLVWRWRIFLAAL